MKAFSFLGGSKRNAQQQRQDPPELLISQAALDDDSDFNIYEPVPTPTSTRSFNSGSLSFGSKNRPTLSFRKPRQSNDVPNSADYHTTQESKLRSPIYTRFGFSKSSSQLPSPPTSVPSPLRSRSALSSVPGGSESPIPHSADVIPKKRAVHLAPVALPSEFVSPPPSKQKGYSLGAPGMRRATVSKAKSSLSPEKRSVALPTDVDTSSTSILLQRRRAKSLGTQAGMVAAAAIKIPPALQLPPRLPLNVRADATQSPLLDTPTRTFPNSVPLESPAGSSIGSPLGNAIVGMGLAVPLPLPRPPIGSPRSSDTRRLRSESSSSRTNSESNSSRARSESASSAASSSRQGYFSSSVSSQNSSLSSSVLFSPRRTSYKAKSKNPSTQSIGSGAGVAMNLDDICDGFLRNIDEDAQESGIEPLFMTSKPSTRKRGVTQVQTQGSHEKFISPCDPQSTLLSYDVSPLAKTTASAPPTVLTFDTRRNRTDSFSNAHTSTMPLPHSTSTTDSDSGNSVDSASTQMTPTKNSRSIRRHDVPVLCFEKQRAMTSPTISGQSTQMAVSVSEASVSSLPYLRSPGVDAGVAASSNQDGPFSSSRASSQTLPAPVSADSFHCLSQPTYPEVDVVSDLPVITAKEPQFGIRPYSSHSQHYDRPASTYSVTSTNSQFSQFSLSLFPSPPSVPFLRPTTDKGTFLTGPSTPEAGNGTETGQSSTYKFKSIVPSRKTPRVQPLLPTDDFSILSSHSRSDSTSSYPLTLGTSSQQPGSLRAESPLPPPNYEALLRSMEATSPLDNSVISMQEGSLGIQVVHAKEAFPNLKVTPSFGGYGPAQLDLPTMASEENSRPGTANSRFQWGYAL